MEEIIKRIVNIESHAKELINNAEKEKNEREKELEKKLKNLKSSLLEDANKKISTIRKKEFEDVSKELEKMEIDCLKKIEKMQRQYEENVDNWVNSLVNAVIKR